jgi:hypothetical protein
MFLISNSVIIGIGMTRKVTLYDLIFFLSEVLITAGVFYWMKKLEESSIDQWISKLRIPVVKTQFKIFHSIGDIVYQTFSGIGNIFESENGMLWALVILQFIILAVGKFGS